MRRTVLEKKEILDALEEAAPRPSIAGVIKTPLSKEFLTDENIDTYNEFFDSDIRKIQDKETY